MFIFIYLSRCLINVHRLSMPTKSYTNRWQQYGERLNFAELLLNIFEYLKEPLLSTISFNYKI